MSADEEAVQAAMDAFHGELADGVYYTARPVMLALGRALLAARRERDEAQQEAAKWMGRFDEAEHRGMEWKERHDALEAERENG